MITFDFETRSPVNLKKTGVGPYAEHPETQVLCAAWFNGDNDDAHLWHCEHPRLFIEEQVGAIPALIEAVESGAIIEAHNASFERAIWAGTWARDYDWAAYLFYECELWKPERWRCSAALAASYALPRSLDGVAEALHLVEQKDKEGKRLIKAANRRSKSGDWTISWEDIHLLWEYCIQDVRTEREVSRALRALPPSEQLVWEADRRMNERGIAIDLDFVTAAQRLREDEFNWISERLRHLSEGLIPKASNRVGLLRWLKEKHGFTLENTQAQTIADLLEGDTELVPQVREALELYSRANKTSVAKYKKAAESATSENRIVEGLLYHGANTGRWSGRGIQVQNLPRGFSWKQNHEVAEAAKELDFEAFSLLHGSPIEVLSKAVRGMLIPSPGHTLFVADYSAIEARVLCWLAGHEAALELFRTGGDVYKDMASAIFKVPYDEVDSTQRFLGKQAVLGLGYGMGALKFRDTVAARGVTRPLAFFKEVINVYRREKYQSIPLLWTELEAAACEAVRTGKLVEQGYFRWKVSGRFLFCRLPSGRLLAYPQPQLRPVRSWLFKAWDPDGELAWISVADPKNSDNPPTYKAQLRADDSGLRLDHVEEPFFKDSHQLIYWTGRGYGAWGRDETYGGKLAENVTQAVARDIMAEALVRADAHPLYHRTLITVHDELVVEAPTGIGNLEEFEALVGEVPAWAQGLPIDVEGWTGERYGK